MRFFRDLSLSAATAGFVAVLVGFTSSVAIVFQAATALGATPAQIASWMWALGIGMGLCSLLPSLWWRKPVMVAWSTPGAAVLATAAAAGGFTLAQAVGAFIVCALLITLFGATGWFERLMDHIPMPIASALLAGVLARFGMDAFVALKSALGLVLLMFTAYLVGRRLWPRYAVPGVLAAGTVYALARGQLQLGELQFALTAAGVRDARVHARRRRQPRAAAVRRDDGLAEPARRRGNARRRLRRCRSRKIITLTGVATLLLAPFGAFALNLSAITAAICMGREAHEDPARRYTAAVTCGAIYCVIGLFGAAVTGVLTAFPRELVVAIAGLALLGTIGGGLAVALQDDAPPRGGADHLPRHAQRRDAWRASARRSGAWSPARSRCLCNSGGPVPLARSRPP